MPHIAGGMVAILVELAQLWLGLRSRTSGLHGTLGRIYLSAVAVASIGALYLAVTIGSENFAHASGLFGLAGAWVITTSMAYLSIRRRAIEQHREWMIRSYVVTFAFVTFRLQLRKIRRPQLIFSAQRFVPPNRLAGPNATSKPPHR